MIEGDPSIADLLANLLADEGHATGGAATMADGLARARAEPWDACVTDGFLVGGGRRVARVPRRPRVLLSRDPAVGARLGAAGASDGPGVAAVIPKPFAL